MVRQETQRHTPRARVPGFQAARAGDGNPTPLQATNRAPLSDTGSKRIAAGVCGILLGSLGVHKFVLGYTKEGVIMLLFSVLT